LFLFHLQQRVDDMNCVELAEVPSNKEDCVMLCSGDCVLSPWTHWSSCPTACQEGYSNPAIQRRERTILALAGRGK